MGCKNENILTCPVWMATEQQPLIMILPKGIRNLIYERSLCGLLEFPEQQIAHTVVGRPGQLGISAVKPKSCPGPSDLLQWSFFYALGLLIRNDKGKHCVGL